MSFLLSLAVLVLGFHNLLSLPDSWPQRYHPAGLRGEHIVKCELEAKKIFWNFPRASNICVRGSTQRKSLHLHLLSHRCTGLYTCINADNNSQNYSEYLLIKEGHNSLSLSCTMDSYTCPVLHCSLTEDVFRPGLVRVKSYSSRIDQEWKEMKIPQDGNLPFMFNIPLPDFCPFEEPVALIHVSVEVMSRSEYLSENKSFYIRDIVVPRAPENVTVTTEQIIWSNPSWTRHLSFFPLLFQIRVEYRNSTIVIKTTEEQNYNVRDVRTFSVRCRDLYYPSAWSSWTPTLKICPVGC
ncbi:interleukin-12 subunit beta-like [Rhinoderma darwinii]|uniref:interleukin-12 subunit beta-like n=1 Tax=Rhinoderma darwinii TaxID=43563 RepID=UPI003F67E01E